MNIGSSPHGRERQPEREDIHLLRSNLKAKNVLRFTFLYSEAQTSNCLTTLDYSYSDEATGWTTEEVGIYSRQRQEIILFSTASRSTFGPMPPSNRMDTGGSFPRGKARGSVKVTIHFHVVSWLRMVGLYLRSPYVFMV
jgi:hypothetical protein